MSSSESELDPVDILIVDDQPSNLGSLQALLNRPDYNVITVESGREALAQVLRREFAVILLDVAMPGMDGFEVASIIKQRDQSKLTPIIFITASVFDMEHIFRGYTVGAVDYLRKPIDPHAVRSKVAIFVQLYRQRKQIEHQSARLREAEAREQRLQLHRAEEALHESVSLYQLTFDEAPIAIGRADPDGRLNRVNRRLAELVGTEVDRLVGTSLEELLIPEEAAALAGWLERLRAGEHGYVGEHRFVHARGRAVWVELTLSALRGEAGLRHIIVVANDITARKWAELERAHLLRELEEGIRARDDFLAIAAHELKTPLTPLCLEAESLLRTLDRQPLSVDVVARRVTAVHRAAERLGALVERLLEVSQLNVGTISLHLEELDLAALVENLVERVRPDAERAGSSLSFEGRSPLRGIGDRLRLEHAVMDLLTNAIKHGAGRSIEVKVSAGPDTAQVSVADHGAGIAREEQERIFQRFERVGSIGNYGGFGLGLWIVKRIAEAHGGSVSVRSEPGQGAEFTMTLPLGVSDRADRLPPAEAHT